MVKKVAPVRVRVTNDDDSWIDSLQEAAQVANARGLTILRVRTQRVRLLVRDHVTTPRKTAGTFLRRVFTLG